MMLFLSWRRLTFHWCCRFVSFPDSFDARISARVCFTFIGFSRYQIAVEFELHTNHCQVAEKRKWGWVGWQKNVSVKLPSVLQVITISLGGYLAVCAIGALELGHLSMRLESNLYQTPVQETAARSEFLKEISLKAPKLTLSTHIPKLQPNQHLETLPLLIKKP